MRQRYLAAYLERDSPGKPEFLAGFLGKIVRNLSISKYRAGHAKSAEAARRRRLLDELEECITIRRKV